MTSIAINKTIYAFLSDALSTDQTRSKMAYVLATDDHKLVTTDGYRQHVVPMERDFTPGYYTYNKQAETLMMVDASAVGGDFFLHANHTSSNFYAAAHTPACSMVTAHFNTVTDRLDFPKVSKVGHGLTFRKGMIGDQHKAVCLGMNSMPFDFDADGNVTLARREDVLILEAKFVQDALRLGLVRPIIRWAPGHRPVLIGDPDDIHVIVMPYASDRWEINNDFAPMRNNLAMQTA